MRPAGKARRPSISGICDGGATPPGGMQRRPNATGLLRRDTRMRWIVRWKEGVMERASATTRRDFLIGAAASGLAFSALANDVLTSRQSAAATGLPTRVLGR